jgi:glyoxylase-like metal-dependent hydrolase (beta-lactamase superfamily II)
MAGPITIRSHGVDLYLVVCRDGLLLVDAGWPRSLPDLRAGLETVGLRLSAIRFVMTSHAHPDHAGLMQKLKRHCGVRRIVHEVQRGSLAELNRFFERKPDRHFEPLEIDEDDLVVGSPNREILRSIGIDGEILETPGHSDDSVTLLLDGGDAFTGDLTRPDLATDANAATLAASWRALLARGAVTIFPGHGGPFAASVIGEMLRIQGRSGDESK